MKHMVLAALLALTPVPLMADVLTEIGERGMVRLGVRDQAPPFSYTDENGEPAGLAVRLCREVVDLIAGAAGQDRLGIEFITVDARQRFPALTEGRTDIHCGPASATLRRRETLDFSILYFVDGAGAAVRTNTYETVFDTGQGTFGYLGGTTTEAVVQDLIDRNSLKVTTTSFQSHGEGLAALADEKLDIYFGDQAILLFQIEAQGLGSQISVMEEVLSFEPYALVMKRGETRLRLAVDRALSTIYDSGLIYRIISEELGEYPLPPETSAVYQIVGLPE